MKFLSPILSPFIVAFLIAGALDRLTDKIPIKMKKSFLASILLLLFVSVLVIAVWAVGSRLLEGCSEFAGNMPLYEEELCMLLSDCCDRMEVRFGVDGTAVEDFVLRQVNVFAENMEVNVFPAIMNKSVGYMKNIAGIVSFLIVTVIAVFLMLKDYGKSIKFTSFITPHNSINRLSNRTKIFYNEGSVYGEHIGLFFFIEIFFLE